MFSILYCSFLFQSQQNRIVKAVSCYSFEGCGQLEVKSAGWEKNTHLNWENLIEEAGFRRGFDFCQTAQSEAALRRH